MTRAKISIVFIFVACGSAPKSSNGGPPMASNFAQRLATLVCPNIASACTDAGYTYASSACAVAIAYGYTRDSMHAFDEAAATACLETPIANLTTDAGLDPSCVLVFGYRDEPVIPANNCGNNPRCDISEYCDGAACQPRVALGGACPPAGADNPVGKQQGPSECVIGAYCNSGGTCANDVNTNAACAASNNCDASLYCGANLTCVARVAIGAMCSDEVRADIGCADFVSCSAISHRCEAGLPLVNGFFCENMPD